MTTTRIDVTVPLRAGGFPVFPGDPPFRRELAASIAGGDVCNTSRLECSVHSGTHVDAPLHFIEGAGGVENLSLDAMIGSAWVADARDATDHLDTTGHLDASAVDALDIPAGTERLLLRTANSQLWESPEFSQDFVALTVDAAEALVERGIRLVGIDYLSIAPFADPAPTHLALLGAGVVVLEGLDLRRVAPGRYLLTCLPILLDGADGAPARVVIEPAS